MTEIMVNSGEKFKVNLYRCPFCGSEPEITSIGNYHTKDRGIKIRCPKCRIQRIHKAIRKDFAWLIATAQDAWNRRKEPK
jgi:DNA-directed RNA polymerase subunit RPC12/RpoP